MHFVQYTQVYTVVYFYFLPLLFCIIVLSLHMLHLQWISTIFAWTGHSIIFKVIKNKNTFSVIFETIETISEALYFRFICDTFLSSEEF